VAYIDQWTLGEDATFQHRVQIAALTSALAIQGEAKTGLSEQQYQKRQALARRVIGDPATHARLFAHLIVTAASVTSATTDATLQNIIDSNWGKAAGIDVSD
jgi:hypothetical protein